MKVYIVGTFTGYMVIKDGRRRGPVFSRKSDASRVARNIVRKAGGGRVLWLNSANKVEREDRLDGTYSVARDRTGAPKQEQSA